MGSLAHERGGLWVEGVAPPSGASRTWSTWPAAWDATPTRWSAGSIAELHEEVRSLRAMGYKGFAGFAQGPRPRSTAS